MIFSRSVFRENAGLGNKKLIHVLLLDEEKLINHYVLYCVDALHTKFQINPVMDFNYRQPVRQVKFIQIWFEGALSSNMYNITYLNIQHIVILFDICLSCERNCSNLL